MSVPYGTVVRAALAAIVVAWAGGQLEAGPVRFESVLVDLPEGWRPLETPDGAVAAWGLATAAGIDASLCVEVHDRATLVRRDLVSGDRHAIERALRAAPGLSGFRLHDHRIVEVDGLPAHRIRGRVEVGGAPGSGSVEQLQLVIAGPETSVLTFTWEEGRASEGDIDGILRSVRIERRAGLLRGGGAGEVAVLLGVLAGAALASRRRVRG